MLSERFSVAGLGGTFDHLHEGHQLLLRTALKVADRLVIGLTSDVMLQKKAYAEFLQSYEERQKNILAFVRTFTENNRVSFVPLVDPFGPAITSAEIQVLVISEETLLNALKVNELRLERNLPPVVLVVIPILPSKASEKLSSTEIRAKLAQQSTIKIAKKLPQKNAKKGIKKVKN